MKKILIASALTALALAVLPGCSVLKGGSGKVNRDTVLPNDRETVHKAAKEDYHYTPADLEAGSLKGDWTIESVDGVQAGGDKVPFIKFVPSEGTVYGNNGCNVINGSYKSDPADRSLRFEGLLSTMMACKPEGLTDLQVMAALENTRHYGIEPDGHDFRLTLYDADRQPLMQLMHCNYEYLTGAWHVTGLDGTPVDIEGMNLVIDVDEGKLHGNTGCNILNGRLETDLETPNSISFSAIATTRMMCPDIAHETQLVVALEEACTARELSADKVVLLGSNRQPVVELTRISPEEADR